MSRYTDRYESRDSDVYRRPRRYRDESSDDDELEVDVSRSRYTEPRRRQETVVQERERDRDTVVSKARTNRTRREPDFLREDYGKSDAGQLVVREDREEDTYSRAPRRRSRETVRSSRPERVEKEEIYIRERSRGGPPYPQSEVSGREEVVYRDRERARSRPPTVRQDSEEDIEVKIKRMHGEPQSAPPRSEYRERDIEIDIEETRSKKPEKRSAPREVEKEEIIIKDDHRSSHPRDSQRGHRVHEEEIDIDIQDRHSHRPRGTHEEEIEIDIRDRHAHRPREVREEEIDIDIRDRHLHRPPQHHRSVSRGNLVAKEREEWIVRKPVSPPPRDYEKEEITIRRKERSASPVPPPAPEADFIVRKKERSLSREPERNYEKEQIIIRRKEHSSSPDERAPSPPHIQPIVRPPIVQDVYTHHHHIDHGFRRALTPTPPPPSPPKEDNIEVEIRRRGVRNGKPFDEDYIIEQDISPEKDKPKSRAASRRPSSHQRSVSIDVRNRSLSAHHRYDEDDDVAAEAEYYNRRAASRGYPGEAYNGATRDWGLVDIPPGTERVRMDGTGGGRQEISWGRYNGDRQSRFVSGDRAYGPEYGLPTAPSAPPIESTRITERRTIEEQIPRNTRTKDKMWTEITKDLVLKEAIDEMGYAYEETEDFFYVVEYLRYEDVLRLVQLTGDIRRERRERIRELQWERERAPAPKMLGPPPIPPPPIASGYDEHIYEREYYVDRERGGRGYR